MNDPVIRISREEANSQHVDDLLQRQKSLRGEPLAQRSTGRRWYMQNWFVFSLVGGLGAFLAWLIIDPYFKDYLYTQGPITQLHQASRSIGESKESHVIPTLGVEIAGQTIWLSTTTAEKRADGRVQIVESDSLNKGDVIGVYIHPGSGTPRGVFLANHIVRNPPAQPAGTETSLVALQSRKLAISMLIFPTVAAMIGLLIGAIDGLICRLPRRALLSGLVGLLAGFVGGLVSGILGEIIYAPLTHLAQQQMASGHDFHSSLGFGIQVLGRSLAWGLCGTTIGLGQGLALRSSRLMMYGLLGGVIGGLLGGLLFDPVDFISAAYQDATADARYSRLVGFVIIGLTVGLMIGLVELLARDAWLRMTQGPLKGKEFLLFKDLMKVGASPRSDLYLFNDARVAQEHAVIRAVGENYEIEARDPAAHPVGVNGSTITRSRLRHGDSVMIGQTSFTFQRRKG